MIERPHITVATVINRDDRFLMVKEESNGEIVYNQPAGHLENGESLQQAALRETFEETGWHIELTGLLGIYHYRSKANDVTYVRVCFIAEALREDNHATLDPDIMAALWLSEAEISKLRAQHRSPIVQTAIEDFKRGIKYPLALIDAP